MKRIDEIATFVQVVEAGGISQAAKQLDISKSSVSKRVSDLEDSLGTQLLYRSSRRVVPTERGLVFYERARAILRQLDEAAEELSEKPDELTGWVRIAAPMSFGILHLGPLLLPLMERHPKLEIAIDLDDRTVDVQGLGYDLAIRIGRLTDSALIARRLATVRTILCCSPAYAERSGLPKTVEDLNHHACLAYGNLRTAEAWQFEPNGGGPARSASPKSRFVSNNGDLIAQAAVAGLGIAILPSFITCDALRAGKLIAIALDAEPVGSALHAVYPQSRHRSRKVRAIIEHLAAEIRDPPPGTALDLENSPRRHGDTKSVLSWRQGFSPTKNLEGWMALSHETGLSKRVIGLAIEVHQQLGPGLLESAYEECLCFELKQASIAFARQVPLPVIYKDIRLDCGYRLDIVAERNLIIEVKSVERLIPIHELRY